MREEAGIGVCNLSPLPRRVWPRYSRSPSFFYFNSPLLSLSLSLFHYKVAVWTCNARLSLEKTQFTSVLTTMSTLNSTHHANVGFEFEISAVERSCLSRLLSSLRLRRKNYAEEGVRMEGPIKERAGKRGQQRRKRDLWRTAELTLKSRRRKDAEEIRTHR